jgi:hypothetical protein
MQFMFFPLFFDKKVDKKSRKFETRLETLRFLLSHMPALTTQKAHLLRARIPIASGTTKIFNLAHTYVKE